MGRTIELFPTRWQQRAVHIFFKKAVERRFLCLCSIPESISVLCSNKQAPVSNQNIITFNHQKKKIGKTCGSFLVLTGYEPHLNSIIK